jgi:hypothetical protein
MLVHITDQLTDGRYLVDTGASFSLVPHRSTKPPAREPRLTGPNGLPIRCWGEERRRLQFGGRTFQWPFLRADVSFAILGVDFLRANKLMVDVASNSLVDSTTGDRFSLTGQPSGHTASIMLPANLPERSKQARPATYAAAAARSTAHQAATPTRKTSPTRPYPSAAQTAGYGPAPTGPTGPAPSTPARLCPSAGGYGPASTGPTGPAPSSPARLYPSAARAAGYGPTPTGPTGPAPSAPARLYPPAGGHGPAPTGPTGPAPPAQPLPTTIPAILDLFRDVLNPEGELPQTSCEVAHFLSTRGPPVASAFRRLDTEKLAAASFSASRRRNGEEMGGPEVRR